VPAATVTSGPLTAGQWNYVPLATPVPLAAGACYNVCTGFSGGFPDTNNQFGAGDPYSAGIVTGPLSAFSDQSGDAGGTIYDAAGRIRCGRHGSHGEHAIGRLPVSQLLDGSPGRNLSTGGHVLSALAELSDASRRSLHRHRRVHLGKRVPAVAVLHSGQDLVYSGPGAAALPTRCAIWNLGTQTEVVGTDNSSPSWSGSAGSGWVPCAYSGVTLSPGDDKVAAFSPGGSPWFQITPSYWEAVDPAPTA
jgi:hypothetical protein